MSVHEQTTTRPTGGELYGWVEAYADFGDHHTGTDVEVETIEWLAGLLADRGAEASPQQFAFDRFTCTAELRTEDGPVPCVPVFYSAVGDLVTTSIEVTEVVDANVGSAAGLDGQLSSAADARVLLIEGPNDLPVQWNRTPQPPGDTPAVIVPGNWAGRIGGPLELRWNATIQSDVGQNLIAVLGPGDGPAVTVSTPLTGWTPCAGERGTGIAAALAMVVELAEKYRVTFVGSGGHELAFIGLEHFLASGTWTPQPVVQLGASVGAMGASSNEDAPELATGRLALTTARDQQRRAIGQAVPAANWELRHLDYWPGESGTWQRAGAEVLAFLGHAPYFHTTGDVPDNVTTPELLALATDVAIDAAHFFLESE